MNPTQLTLILACFLMPIENPTQSETASPVVNSYIKTLEAQHLLMKTVAAREYSKHASLEELHRNGHATWMEMRQQQLRSSVLQARAKSFGEFVAVFKNSGAAKQNLNRGHCRPAKRDNLVYRSCRRLSGKPHNHELLASLAELAGANGSTFW